MNQEQAIEQAERVLTNSLLSDESNREWAIDENDMVSQIIEGGQYEQN